MKPHIDCVMLIDDEHFDQKLYRRVIARSGIVGKVISYSYADEALEYLKSPEREVIDIIFLDINMPRMNGFEFLEAATRDLGAQFTKMVVVMLTTSLERSDHDRAKGYAVVKRFINKPLTGAHLLELAELLHPENIG